MIRCKPGTKKSFIIILLLSVVSFSKLSAQNGETIFRSTCAACHALDADLTGPHLRGVLDREPYNGDINKIIKWVKNPHALIISDPYYKALKDKFAGVEMPAQTLSDDEIKSIITFVNTPAAPDTGGGPATTAPPSAKNWIIFGVISLIMAIIALILMQVNSNLKKLSDDAEGISRPEPVPFYRNKAYIALLTIILFIFAGFFITKGAIGLGRQIDYSPQQPIFYSHKVHAGTNQISCLYCHGNAWESRHAAVPSVNVCMNCHKTITSYKGATLYNEEGDSVNGTAQLNTLFKYAGFDPSNATAWKPENAKPIPWIRIHSLPDHVYFNHSQHIRAGKVQCQTCHGPITEMNEVKQFSELSMGWCINCHRETKVNYNLADGSGNKFYQMYEKFFKHSGKDSITVKDIGGTECQRCHY